MNEIHIDELEKEYEGLVTIPQWANWKATDENGGVYLYENDPHEFYGIWIGSGGKEKNIDYSLDFGDWTKTKQRIIR